MKSKLHVFLFVIAVTLGMIAMLAGCSSQAPATADAAKTITVTATAEQHITPDKAAIEVSIVTQAKTAPACQEQNASNVDAVVNALVEAGIDEAHVQTTYTNLYPQRDYTSAQPEVVGYEMYTTLSVEGIDIQDAGSIMQTAIAHGATGIGGMRYYASDYDQAYADALTDAIAAAGDKAQVIANASNVKLGGVVKVEEGYQNTAYKYEADMLATGAMGSTESDNAAIMPGEIDIEAQVTVTFAIS